MGGGAGFSIGRAVLLRAGEQRKGRHAVRSQVLLGEGGRVSRWCFTIMALSY